MAISSSVGVMESDDVSQGDYSCNSETTAGAETSASEDDDGKGIQIKIKRAIENGILDEAKKKRKILNFDRSLKKRKNLKIEQEGFKISIRKFRLFKIDHVKKKGEEMLPPARNDREVSTRADEDKAGAAK
ncbi:hypothetical protein PCYB_053520 [Plasmodium cynomolgi strain B]|uniref:Uncharacterized protein n=1 Tax=Plasmodium cynomolgi (strain B) TaxID=1120755 RepID=K6UQU0_PLACD|nr:hypothetical protein PCYB_053520 [Plasmodium cynomolgi strain B]GAB65334.1 hypothetical protein PCYB_053520 [Plasmodium cynomolgi strain B]